MGTIPDAVQPPDWASPLPRAWYRSRSRIATQRPWFDVYALPCGGYAIYEPGHFQEVISYVFVGSERALVWDTGMGMDNIRALVGELTDKPLIVLNSHTHFDHMGGNHLFAEVWALDHPIARKRVGEGLSRGMVSMHTSPDQFAKPLPEGFDPAAYEIRGANYRPLKPETTLDLGGRQWRVLHTPGHSPESIMLYDEANSILLTGDTFYPATLYSHLDSGDGMKSDFAQYRATMRRLADELGGVKTLYCSHNEPAVTGSKLGAVADAFDAIAQDRAEYQSDERGLRLYAFDGFAIVTDPSKIK